MRERVEPNAPVENLKTFYRWGWLPLIAGCALIAVAVIMTIGVYGLVAGIVKLDDAGVMLSARGGRVAKAVAAAILRGAPLLMKALGVAGTVAMFLVGGGIVTHGIAPLHAAVVSIAEHTGSLGVILATLTDFLVGVVLGGLCVAAVSLIGRVRRRARS